MKNYEKNYYISLSILVFSLLAGYTIVSADSVSTAVTVGNATPSISATTLNSSNAIVLTENTTTTVYATTTVTDANGCSTITNVIADFYRSGVTASGCDTAGESNNNSCYPIQSCTVVGGTCSGALDTTANYVCSVSLQYYADPTDAGTYSAQTWTVNISASDGVATSTDATATAELNQLTALNVTASIAYGTVPANTDTGSTNQTTTVTNTGNTAIDPDISGTDMVDGLNEIGVEYQKYSDAAFTYTSGGTALSTTPTSINLTLPQRTSGVVTDDVLWGIGVPAGTVPGSYTGTNTFTAVAE